MKVVAFLLICFLTFYQSNKIDFDDMFEDFEKTRKEMEDRLKSDSEKIEKEAEENMRISRIGIDLLDSSKINHDLFIENTDEEFIIELPIIQDSGFQWIHTNKTLNCSRIENKENHNSRFNCRNQNAIPFTEEKQTARFVYTSPRSVGEQKNHTILLHATRNFNIFSKSKTVQLISH